MEILDKGTITSSEKISLKAVSIQEEDAHTAHIVALSIGTDFEAHTNNHNATEQKQQKRQTQDFMPHT
jgi:hypothetical protein